MGGEFNNETVEQLINCVWICHCVWVWHGIKTSPTST